MKIHKSHISYVVRNGKIIYADHQTFNKWGDQIWLN
jgi:hypothetical protein